MTEEEQKEALQLLWEVQEYQMSFALLERIQDFLRKQGKLEN